MKEVSSKPITLRRDGKGPLKFNGERIGSATRRSQSEDNDGEMKSHEISAKLFKTTGGKYVLGVEVYNHTDEQYEAREGWIAGSPEELVELLAPLKSKSGVPITNPLYAVSDWLDADILAEVFEHTEAGDSFVEHVD